MAIRRPLIASGDNPRFVRRSFAPFLACLCAAALLSSPVFGGYGKFRKESSPVIGGGYGSSGLRPPFPGTFRAMAAWRENTPPNLGALQKICSRTYSLSNTHSVVAECETLEARDLAVKTMRANVGGGFLDGSAVVDVAISARGGFGGGGEEERKGEVFTSTRDEEEDSSSSSRGVNISPIFTRPREHEEDPPRRDPRTRNTRRAQQSSPGSRPDPLFGKQLDLHLLGARRAWQIFDTDKIVQSGEPALVTVAVMDSGVDYDHPDVAETMWRNALELPNDGLDNDGNGWVDDVFGIDVVNGDGDPMDDAWHGTAMAGIAGRVLAATILTKLMVEDERGDGGKTNNLFVIPTTARSQFVKSRSCMQKSCAQKSFSGQVVSCKFRIRVYWVKMFFYRPVPVSVDPTLPHQPALVTTDSESRLWPAAPPIAPVASA